MTKPKLDCMTYRLFVLLLFQIVCFQQLTAQHVRSGNERPLNFLLITADDMNWDSPGCYGGEVPNITPNIDRLAEQGIRFQHAYINAAACMPSRNSLLTGLYPHNNGAEGFEPINPEISTLPEILHANGYLNGIMGKEDHPLPMGKYYWDFFKRTRTDLGNGREPSKYYTYTKEFIQKAKEEGKPFFLMANSNDPHRPFAGDEVEQHRMKLGKGASKFSRKIFPDEVTIPPFLPNVEGQVEEMAAYYTSVYRCDETVGMVLTALDESGMAENTVVFFLSDHGMPFPFSKETCLPNGTRTPWIVRWPGVVEEGTVEREYIPSGIDFVPTVLDLAGIEVKDSFDGKSLAPVLKREKSTKQEFVFSEFHETGGYEWHPEYVTKPMRAIHSKRFHYVVNFWSNGERTSKGTWAEEAWFRHYITDVFLNNSKESLKRYYLNFHQSPRQFFDTEDDPDCMNNLIDDPDYKDLINEYHERLLVHLKESDDPAYKALKKNTAESFEKFYQYQYQKSKDRERIKRINESWPLKSEKLE